MPTHRDALDPEGDALIAAWEAAETNIRNHTFPRLVVEKVTDDGETFDALRCPRCGAIVADEDLYAIDVAVRANEAQLMGDEDFDYRRIVFYAESGTDFGETMNYMHGDHQVSLPEGWQESWS